MGKGTRREYAEAHRGLHSETSGVRDFCQSSSSGGNEVMVVVSEEATELVSSLSSGELRWWRERFAGVRLRVGRDVRGVRGEFGASSGFGRP